MVERKSMNSKLTAFVIAIATTPGAFAAPQALTVKDLTIAAQRNEHDRNSISRLLGKQITLTLTKADRSHLFNVQGDPGLVAICPVNSKFEGGTITAKLVKFQLDSDLGGEDANVVMLESCSK